HAEAARSYRHASELARQVAAANPGTPHHRVLLVMTLTLIQQEKALLGSVAEAEESDRQALEAVQQLVADYPDLPYYQELLGWTWDCLCFGRECLGQVQKEEEAGRQGLAAYDKLMKAFPTLPRYQNQALGTQQSLAELLWSTGRRAEATELFRQIRDWTDRVSPEDAAGHDCRAYFLATCPDPQFCNPRRAVELAKRATTLVPKEKGYWT